MEAKLDGMRVKIHRDGDAVRVFTRSLRDVTVPGRQGPDGEPWSERRQALAGICPAELLVDAVETADPEEAQRFVDRTLQAGHEGVVVKAADGTYEAGRRGHAWIRVKPALTLDMVVLAVEWGSGRRAGYLSNLHLGARDTIDTVRQLHAR